MIASDPSGAQAQAAASPPLLDVSGIVKVYGGTVALRGVSFSVNRGEIHGLVGENGAGKSTLVRIIAGIERQDSGEIRLLTESDVQQQSHLHGGHGRHECAVIHQNLALIETMSVAENIALATGYRRTGGVINWRATRRKAREALDQLGVKMDPGAEVSELAVAQRAIVAIARALAQDAKLVVFDEPTATLQAAEVKTLFRILEKLRQSGVACLLISHRIDEVLSACDRLTVLRDGAVVGTWRTADLSTRQLIEHMLGRKTDPFERSAPRVEEEVLLRVEDACVENVGPVDFVIRRGEIFGITGLADAGHLTLAEAFFGIKRITSGRVLLAGRPYHPTGPSDAVAAGAAYVPPDRHREAIASELSARENLFMSPSQHALRPLLLRRERKAASTLMESFDVRPPEPERELSTFSGGNQQKIILAKWLASPKKLVILCEPTASVDVGAKLAIYELLRKACSSGETAVIIASSDFEEVAMVADRVLVLYRGKPVRILDRDELSTELVIQAAYDLLSEMDGVEGDG